MDEDPVFQFFPDQDSVDLYAVLGLPTTATVDEIKRSYRRLALIHHPDKHASASEEKQKEEGLKFQQVGYAYAVLSDETRKKKYDDTGRTDEGGAGFGPEGDQTWDDYFAGMFEQVTRAKLDELKKEYVGSQEEREDVASAYLEGEGSIEHLMAHIPFTSFEDEGRIISVVKDLIKAGTLTATQTWKKDLKDTKAQKARKKQGEAEAAEAEKAAKEMGVWDEFYGSGKATQRKPKGKGKQKAGDEEDEGDVSNLQALIQKRATTRGSFLENLAAKYGAIEEEEEAVVDMGKSKGKKKRGRKTAELDDDVDEDAGPPKRRGKKEATPDLDDAEFERIQQELMARKAANSGAKTTAGGRKKAKAK